MNAVDRFDVVVAGASFAGLALACALSRALGPGLRIAVLDRVAPPLITSPDGDPRASAIAAGSRRMLEVLGVWPEVAEAAQAVTQVEITDSPLEAGIRPVLLRYDTDLGDGDPAPAMHIVPNAVLLATLARLVAADTDITLITPADVIATDRTGPRATVTLAGGRQLTAALLIGADGRRSRMRELAGIGVVSWSSSQRGIVTTVSHERPHQGRAVQHFLPAGPFAILPLRAEIADRSTRSAAVPGLVPGTHTPSPHNLGTGIALQNGPVVMVIGHKAQGDVDRSVRDHLSCITWSEEAARAEEILALDDQRFLDEVDLRFGGRLGVLALAGPRRSWPLDMHLARAYVAPRLALVGDAAHAVHPIAGQGLNLALRDVAALAEAIADGARLGLDLADATILERYERWRRFDSALSAAAFDGLNRLFSVDVRLLRSAREAGLGMVDRVPALKRWLVAEAAGLTGDVPKLMRGVGI